MIFWKMINEKYVFLKTMNKINKNLSQYYMVSKRRSMKGGRKCGVYKRKLSGGGRKCGVYKRKLSGGGRKCGTYKKKSVRKSRKQRGGYPNVYKVSTKKGGYMGYGQGGSHLGSYVTTSPIQRL